ncbi:MULTISPECIES: hypothetical protein [unclassified Nocardioides]|uniref:hypothetical protein n=1 Tax=unclassified Nocardioides TaxID=2615069 RepID=UPI00360FEC91
MSGDRNEPDGPDVGTVAEEAAKLLGALSGWAKDATHDLDEHLAPGAPECTYCPICRTVHAVRELSPEVKDQLATAATSALQAIAGLVGAAGRSAHTSGGAGGVEHIDLDEDAGDWPDDHTDPEGEDR